MYSSYLDGISWEKSVKYIDELSKVTKKEIVKSIQSNFSVDIQNVISDNNNSKINNAIIILASAVVISVSTYFIFNNTKTFSDAIRRN